LNLKENRVRKNSCRMTRRSFFRHTDRSFGIVGLRVICIRPHKTFLISWLVPFRLTSIDPAGFFPFLKSDGANF